MRRPGWLFLLLLSFGFVAQAPPALCQVAPLTSDTRERLAKAAQTSPVQPWQRSFMLEMAKASPESATVQPSAALPGLALPLSSNPAWSALAPPGESAARYYSAAIYDPVRDRMVVFGGIDGLGPHNDVWALSLSGDPAWSALTPVGEISLPALRRRRDLRPGARPDDRVRGI